MQLGFVGTGAMSGAIARGLRASGDAQTKIFLYDVSAAAAEKLAGDVQGTVVPDLQALTQSCDLIILGVKPHIQSLVLAEIAPAIRPEHHPALLSIAAGRTLAAMEADLGPAAALVPLIRVMPNVNAQIGLSMSAIAYAGQVPEEVRAQARRIFEAVGQTLELPEAHFAEFAALAGCSPAWFFQIADSFARAGVKYGLTKEQALASVTQSMLGSARMIQIAAKEGTNPSALIDRVCSPGGTTVAGLVAAQGAGLDNALVAAVDAAVARDRELGK